MFLSMTQLYFISLGDFNVSLYPIFLMLSTYFIKWGYVLRQRIVQITAVIIIYNIISWFWAIDILEGVKEGYFCLIFLGALCLCISYSYRERIKFISVCRAYSVLTLFQSGLVIIFRALPSIKLAFLGSAVGSIFISKTGTATYTMSTIMDPGKSGGLLLTPNAAGALSLGLAFLTLASFRRSRLQFIGYIVSAVHFMAAATCGSKATLIISAVLIGALVFHAMVERIPNRSLRNLVTGSFITIFGFSAVVIFPILEAGKFFQDSAASVSSRSIMWSFALEQFKRTPFLGMGYGGWRNEFASLGDQYKGFGIGVSGALAPHNLFIDVWTVSGIPAVLLALAFIFIVYQVLFKAYRVDPGRGKFLIAGFSAYILQSLGENYGLFSSPVMSGVLAVTLGLGNALALTPATPSRAEVATRRPNASGARARTRTQASAGA